MGTLIKQECFKLFKKKSTFIIPIVIIAIMLILAIVSSQYSSIFSPEENFKNGYSSFSWAIFLLIIQASTIITMEFHYGTIKNLLYRTLFIYSIIIFAIFLGITIVLHLIFNGDTSLIEASQNKESLLSDLLLRTLGVFVAMWLLISLTLLISCIMKSPGVSIAVGIIFYFAVSIISGILFAIINKWEWLKWNPINMMNIQIQVIDNKAFKELTKLELHELFIGNIVYILIFLILVVWIFKKKNV